MQAVSSIILKISKKVTYALENSLFAISKYNLYATILDVDAHSINGSSHLPDTFPIVTRSFKGTHKCHPNSSQVHFE